MAVADPRTSPPDGCISVNMDGSKEFTAIQSAVDSLDTTATGSQCIFIYPGNYSEQVTVVARKAQLSIYGYTNDGSSYESNTVTITGNKSQMLKISNDETATLRVKSRNFRLYNVNVENTFGPGSQAVALSAMEDSGYYGCQFWGHQDTVYAQRGYQIYVKTLIVGAVDFIFGKKCLALFHHVDIRVLPPAKGANEGYITAHGANSTDTLSLYVFNECDVAAAPESDGTDQNTIGKYYLGRPWGLLAFVVFQKSTLSNVINPAGWSVWKNSLGQTRTGNATFAEYGNTGDGHDTSARASFSHVLAEPITIEFVLSSSYRSQGYFDAAYMP